MVDGEFVGIFGVQSFAFFQHKNLIGDLNFLFFQTHQMHFDAVQRGVVKSPMGILTEDKIGFQLPVGTGQQIQVESGRHTLCVVVGLVNDVRRFQQIHP